MYTLFSGRYWQYGSDHRKTAEMSTSFPDPLRGSKPAPRYVINQKADTLAATREMRSFQEKTGKWTFCLSPPGRALRGQSVKNSFDWYSLEVFMNGSPIGYQTQEIWGYVSWATATKAWVQMCAQAPFWEKRVIWSKLWETVEEVSASYPAPGEDHNSP